MYKALFWICAVFILIVSLLPVKDEGVGKVSDKHLHFLAYLGFSYLLLRSYNLGFSNSFLLSAAFGLFVELLQLLSGYRSFDMVDIHYNNIGAFIGLGLFYIRSTYLVKIKLIRNLI